MSNEPLLPSYGAATQRTRSSEYRPVVAKHTHASRTLMESICALVFFTSAILATVWAADTPDLVPIGSAPLLPYFASISLVVSTCFWLGHVLFIANDAHSGSLSKRKIIVGIAVVGKLVLAAAHVAIWQAYKMWYEGLWTPNWAIVFMAAQAWFDVVFVAINGWVL